jgi:hypothetical protein
MVGAALIKSVYALPTWTRTVRNHGYDRPTVKLYGMQAEGWRALALCKDHGYPVLRLDRSSDM